MAGHRLTRSKTRRTNLAPSHKSLSHHPPSLLKFSSHTYSQNTMKTTSGGSHTEESVVGGTLDVANEVGLPTTASLGVVEGPNDSTEVIESHQEEEHVADAISEDGISPDDAPEVVLDDINEEVRTITHWVTTNELIQVVNRARKARPVCLGDWATHRVLPP